MRCLAPMVFILALLLFFALPARAETRTALVIGNGAYKDAPLKNPANDARDMASALKGLGFDVMLLTDATHQQMDSAVRDFGKVLRQGGVGLFYFAGHGVQVAGENYLVPVNARISSEADVKFGCLNAGLVLAKMDDANNGLNVVILDACRNNPFARSFRSAETGLAKMDAPTGSLIAYATSPGSVAADGSGRNGVYTEHLLKNLRTPGLSVMDLFMRVRMGGVAETGKKQVPWEASSLTGYFYFNGQGGQGAPAPLPLAAAAAPVVPAPVHKLDAKAEKKHLADEAARIRREKAELAELNAIQAEKARLEAERQQLEQAKLLATISRPNPVQPAAHADMAARVVGRYAEYMPEYGKNNGLFFEFVLKEGRLVGATSGETGGVSPVEVGDVRIEGGALRFRFTYKKGFLGIGGTTYTDYTCDISGGLDRLPTTYVSESGHRGRHELVRVADAAPFLAQLAGRYGVVPGPGKAPGPLVFEFGFRDGQLFGTPSGGGSATRPVSITNIRLQGKTLSFRYHYKLVVFGVASDGHTDFTGDLGGERSSLPFKAVTHDGTSRDVWLERLPDAH